MALNRPKKVKGRPKDKNHKRALKYLKIEVREHTCVR